MEQKNTKKFIYWLEIAAVGIVLGLILQGARAWTEPSEAPPGGNLGAPLNTSGNTQVKMGPLGVNSNDNPVGLTVLGHVGIGTTSPQTNLDVAGNIYGWNVPRDIKTTTATHNGNFGGYQGMYNWIQSNGCSGYHVCDNTELTRYYQLHSSDSLSGWQNTGLKSISSYAFNDCYSWTRTDQYASLWIQPMNASANEAGCSESHPVMCCK